MAIPELIKINRVKGYHTHYIGKYRGKKQFMAFVTASLPEKYDLDKVDQVKRWYAVIHLFDKEGNHIETKHKFLGPFENGTKCDTKQEMKELAKLIAEINPNRYGSIKIKPFKVEIDGRIFGLVDASVPEEKYESVHLLPNDLAFFPPWDGNYDT